MEAFQSAGGAVLDRHDAAYRQAFYGWAKRCLQGTVQDLGEARRAAQFAMNGQVSSGKLAELRHGARAGLFANGYLLLVNYRRKAKRIFWRGRMVDARGKDPVFQVLPGDGPLDGRREWLLFAKKEVPPPWGELLRQRFSWEKNIPDIQAPLGFRSAHGLSVPLWGGLQRRREIIQSKRS